MLSQVSYRGTPQYDRISAHKPPQTLSDLKHLHYLVAQVVDYLDGDAARLGPGKGAGRVAVERRPGVFVDLRFERGLERAVGVVCTQEIGVTHEEALLVVVGVDEPTGDALRTVAAHLAGVGMKHVHPVDLDAHLAVCRGQDVDVRLAEDDEQVALAGVFQLNFLLVGRRTALTVCQATIIAITVVLPAPVASFNASRTNNGLASLLAFPRCSKKPLPNLSFGATSVSQMIVSIASSWQKKGR